MREGSLLVCISLVTVILVLARSLSSAPKNKAPSVQMTVLVGRAVFVAPATISLAATASDRDGTIAKVEFFSGSPSLGIDNSPPYTFEWTNVPAGSYLLTAQATDNEGAAHTSRAVNIVVQGSNSRSTVSITSPANGASFSEPAQIAITATASGGSIAKVEFFQGSTLLATSLSVPYSFLWNNVGSGHFLLSARATDNAGLATTSSANRASRRSTASHSPNSFFPCQ